MTTQFTAAANKREGHTHVLLLTTGSVASIKAPLIVDELLKVRKHTTQQIPAHSGILAFLFSYYFSLPSTRTCRCKWPRPSRRSRSSSRRTSADWEWTSGRMTTNGMYVGHCPTHIVPIPLFCSSCSRSLCSSFRPLSSWRLQANYRIGDPILHIELRRWADIVLIAPCSANTLAKIASGVCDNLVVSPSPTSVPNSRSTRLDSPHHIPSLIFLLLFPKTK